MKLIILTFLISLCANAAYIGESSIGECEGVLKSFTSHSRCKLSLKEDCYQTPKPYRCEYHTLSDEMIDDLDSPIWATRSMVEVCAGEQDCKDKALAKECVDNRHALYNAEYSEVWCNKITGYLKKPSGKKVISVDQVKKDAYDLLISQKGADKAAMQMAERIEKCGKRVIRRLFVRNGSKGLTKPQVRQIVSTYKDIKALLETGSLESAREDILAVVADGTLVTEGDKTALIAELDACKP